MKPKIIVISLFAILVIGLLAGIVFLSQRESLMLDGSVHLEALERPVKIYFDQFSIPYIEASSEKDLSISQGFVAASQRLFQMDILRRIAKGEMAAIFGNSCLPNDKLARLIGFARIAEAEYGLLSSDTKRWLKAYCQGINSYIARGSLPAEFIILGYEPQPWQPEDSLAILKYLQYASDESWQLSVLQNSIAKKGGLSLAKRLFGNALLSSSLETSASGESKDDQIEKTSFSQPDLKLMTNLVSEMPQAANISWGSHAWAISEEMSQSERALLACDKETLCSFPNLFFLTSLKTPSLHVAGLTIPGIPGILIGRNDNLSWSAVNLKAKSQTLCVEALSTKSTNQYSNKQGTFTVNEIHEEIPSRFAPTRMEKITITKDGPLLTKNGQIGIALNWYGSNPANNTIETILPLNKAKNWSQFNSALQKYKGSLQAFIYADTTGNIGKNISSYNKHIGQLLQQDTGDKSLNESKDSKSPADKSPDDKTTQNKLASLPKFIVATEGQIYPNANLDNGISLMSSGSTWAAMRAIQVLSRNQSSKTKLSLENMIALLADVKAPLSELVTKTLIDAMVITNNSDNFERAALSVLTSWDGQLATNSSAATIYEAFISNFTKRILQAKLGQDLSIEYINKWPYWTSYAANLLAKQPNDMLPAGQSNFNLFILNCFSQSLNNLHLVFKINPITNHVQKMQWQILHKLDFRANLSRFFPSNLVNAFSILLPAPVGLPGDQDCLNSCNYQISNETPFYSCNSAPCARLLIDMADNDKFYHSLISGQCGHLFTKDTIYGNELKTWGKLEFRPIAFSQKQLQRATRHLLLLDNSVE